MKKRKLTLLSAIAMAVTMMAQTITVTQADGTVTQINASDAGNMIWTETDGTLNIGGQAYKVAQLDVDTENANIATGSVAGTTDAAKRLYRYFRNNYGQRIISSVMADVAWNHSLAFRNLFTRISKNVSIDLL